MNSASKYIPACLCIILFCSIIAVQGCKNIGYNSVKEITSFTDSLLVETDTMRVVGAKLAQGAIDSLTSPANQPKLDATAKHIAEAVGEGLVPVFSDVLDTLNVRADTLVEKLAHAIRRQLQSDSTMYAVTGLEDEILNRLEASVARMRDEILSEQSGKQLGEAFAAFLNEETLAHLQASRDSILNEEFHDYVVDIVAHAGDTLAVKLDRVLDEGREAGTEFLWLAGLFIAGLMLLSWILFRRGNQFQARKNELETLEDQKNKLLKLMTYEIHKMPSQANYNDLVEQIQTEAQRLSLEPLLRESLEAQGILGSGAWNP